ncbi:MAG: hypothetical protein Harvfovirus41_10 [Harvfovirus sp.]|uniref:Uncharacterized protein n=1 Tax=Harvfovirus sp. TaxID=2487768 RepID=A0A3G5A2Y9_9VIRU|nr:MAG: hypothetical protein Harvfovirus41_10 [Harvfovirus sp.]
MAFGFRIGLLFLLVAVAVSAAYPKKKIMTIGSIETIIHHQFREIREEQWLRYVVNSTLEADRHSFGTSALLVNYNTLFMDYTYYEATCAKLPLGIDLKTRGKSWVFDNRKYIQTEPRNIQIIDKLRSRGMKIMFIVDSINEYEFLEWLLEELGYSQAQIFIRHTTVSNIFYEVKLFVLEESFSNFDSVDTYYGFFAKDVTLLEYIKFID